MIKMNQNVEKSLSSCTKTILYTMSECSDCKTLKSGLVERSIQFEEVPLDTNQKVKLVLRDIFDNPPILRVGEKFLTSSVLFEGGALNEDVLNNLLANL